MFAPLPLAAALLFAAPPPDGPPDVEPPGEAQTVAGRTLEQWAVDLADDRRPVRGRAALSLRAFGSAAAPALAAALNHGDEAVRFWAADGLALTPAAAAAVAALPRLREMMTGGNTGERFAAAFAVAKIDPDAAADALPALLAGLSHKSRGVNLTAADFLARLGDVANPAGDRLNEIARDHADYHVRYRVAQAYRAATGETIPLSEIMR